MSDIKFSCPKCTGSISAGPEWFGKDTSCPHCNRQINIPTAPVGAGKALSDPTPVRLVCGDSYPSLETAAPLTTPAVERRWEDDHFIFRCPACQTQARFQGWAVRERMVTCPACNTVVDLTTTTGLAPEDPAPYRVSVASLLFSYQGRVTRLHFWSLGVLPTFALPVVASILLQAGGEEREMKTNAVFLFMLLWLIPVGLPIMVKRLHDRGKSGHWAWLLFLPLLANIPASEIYPALGVVGALAAIVVPVVLVVSLGMFRGQVDVNRFGPPPSLLRYR